MEESRVSYNVKYLKESAENLSELHSSTESTREIRPIQPILDRSKKVLDEAYTVLSGLAKENRDLSPAAEWLIDNFYIIQEQIVQVGIDFPTEFQNKIPALKDGEHKGLPRVYELLMTLLTHTDNVVDEEVLIHYIESYQEREKLMQGEVWAIPIMVRLILVQKLAEKASRILARKRIWRDVNNMIRDLSDRDLQEPGQLIAIISHWVANRKREYPELRILIELYNQLQQSGMLLDEQKRWFSYRFKQHDISIDDAIQVEVQRESRLQVSIQNAVITLRESAETNWSDFVEACSVIEKILKRDPFNIYDKMDFETRDRYRKAVEKLSLRSKYTEWEVAELAVKKAAEVPVDNGEEAGDNLHNREAVKRHVGYYLTGDGYRAFSKSLEYKMPLHERARLRFERQSFWYIWSIILHTIGLMVILWLLTDAVSESVLISTTVLLVALFPALDLSVSAVNRFFAFFLPPRKLPKMDYKDLGIPDSSRTLVVVPTLFSSAEDVKNQLEKLELRSLSNPNPKLQFAILSDFHDSDSVSEEKDADILRAAKEEITALNKKYKSAYGDKFFVLHRDRIWNETENCWMGWERKRGKLEELDKVLCDHEADTFFTHIFGDFIPSISRLKVRYVITLDADTKMPPDSAVNLVRTIAHPLNWPWFDPDKKRIIKGYAIIQPRISISPASAQKTWFSKIFSGNVGLDPYSTAVSDIYQDLTGEAVFTGKGIYDVEAFHEVLTNRFPENRILSHDLIESTYLRAGFATDIELFDDFPTTYASYSKRNHRWVRGDWQIASWIFKRVPTSDEKEKNPINLLSKWKVFDNIRRSLNPLFLTIFFVAGWFWLPGDPWLWTLFAFGILAFPIYVTLSSDIINRPRVVRWKLYWQKVRLNLKMNTLQSLFVVIILPHQAVVNLDAIFRTLYRLLISKKNLLEWTTASHTEQNSSNSLGAYIRSLSFSIYLGIALLTAAFYVSIQSFWVLIPFFVIWTGAPFFLWYVSHPVEDFFEPYSEADEKKMREYARRTWFYFERFVNKEHSWLPPDNFQVDPPLPEFDRTSPTNIGLSLVSTQVAYNRGYITYSELLDRVENTLVSLEKLERFRGHFYNWYETKLGDVLDPKYISTVDSGNLAAGLIVIKEGIKKSSSAKINENYREGLIDTIETLKSIFEQLNETYELPHRCYNRVMVFSNKMLTHLAESEKEGIVLMRKLKKDAANLSAINLLPLGSHIDDKKMQDLLFWLNSPLKQVEKAIAEWKCFNISDEVDIHKYSPEEFNSQMLNRYDYPQCVLMLNRWMKQKKHIISICEKLIEEMDFSFLYLPKRSLFSIGYNVEKATLDTSTYDLLASEARIASYIAISKGDVPAEHWFSLSRRLTSLNRNEILLSWGGTMFEYLMPLLFMKSYPDTLMDQTYRNVVRWQKEYGERQKLPWGFSESAYYFLNIDLHYQYRTFGAPGLGLKRGLAEDHVVAPYASMMSLMVDAKASMRNLEELEHSGGYGLYGFFDAVDFTPSRLEKSEKQKVVKSYMVHHHGMGLLAIENTLNNRVIHDYFHADARIKSCELILQERIPRGIPIKEPHPIEVELEPGAQEAIQNVVEHAGIDNLDTAPPRLHILSNPNYSTIITHSGTGGAKFNGVTMNGWDADPTTNPLGFFFYIKDCNSGEFWSATHQPVKRKPDRYDTWFHNGKVITSRVDEWIETTTEAAVSPDYPMEFRKITLTNYSHKKRVLEVTSYAEVVLNKLNDHLSHPAFSKLFIQTDYLPEHHAIIAKRRPRSEEEQPMWLVHPFATDSFEKLEEPLQFETERSKFIGRGRSLSHPAAMDENHRLEGSLGNVSDPIVSLRKRVTIKPGEKMVCSFGLGYAGSREEAIQLADIFDNQHSVQRAFDLASMYSSVELNQIGINSKEAHYFQKLASYLIYSDKKFRADDDRLRENRKKQHDLWAYGISGDLPLIVFRMNSTDQLNSLKRLLDAHTFWRMKGLETEMLILNEHPPSYADEVHEAIQREIEISSERDLMNKYGGLFLERSDKLPSEDLSLIMSMAHLVLNKYLPYPEDLIASPVGTLSWYSNIGEIKSLKSNNGQSVSKKGKSENEVQFYNGFGGFSKSGREYTMFIKPDEQTGRLKFPPAPWINVIANKDFGFTASERGAGYTWSQNSRENKLTTWSNDPVKDPHSEAFYIRDNENNNSWSPTPGPMPGNDKYVVTHGFGYTTYKYSSENLDQELTQFVPLEGAVKISQLTLSNTGKKERRLSLFRYSDRVLGVNRKSASRHVVSQADEDGKTLYAKSFYNNEFAGRTVFSSIQDGGVASNTWFTTDRKSFIGRNRSLSSPAAVVSGQTLDEKVVIGEDVCAALQADIELSAGETKTIWFLDGEATSMEKAESMINRFSEIGSVDNAFEEVRQYWEKTLTKIQVSTPDRSLDLMLNGWLMYQNLSSRMWGRTAYYQAGGAFGFRDQLQDVMSVLYVDSDITREQILLHASKQFKEGDVLHWWHPPTGRGIRSKITDDRLWLPYVTENYIRKTGDASILEEQIAYIEARKLEEYEHEVYLTPHVMDEKGTLYEHCCKAIDISLQFGEHGLPLIGAGDWNDGMNRVGQGGRGESVWLGFFIYDTLIKFQKICTKMGDGKRAERYQRVASTLKKKLNSEGWDGEWYLRAFYDDGTPLGSIENDECKIDAISQAWSVISGVASEDRAAKSLQAVEKHLISERDKIIRLLSPPFDETEKSPGYIKGYIPGVRENGGQYTHGALWVIKAMAELGMGEKAVKYIHMINPINHATTEEEALKYKVEPYVVAADVYGEPPLNGMGGWTWYTGSCGWMYRVMLESVLGFLIADGQIILKPSISKTWKEYKITYTADDKGTEYHITVANPEGYETGRLYGTVDGKTVRFDDREAAISILHDGKRHTVELSLTADPVNA